MRGEPQRSLVTCSTLECPQVTAYFRGEAGTLFEMPKEQALRDTSGSYWCKQCSKQYDLMNWGAAHKWPEVSFPPYAIIADEEVWKVSIAMGTQDYIAAFHAAIFAEEQAS